MPVPRNVPPEVARQRATLARAVQLGSSAEKITEARAALKAAGLAARIRADVDSWPPLSDADRADLILLLSSGTSDA